MHSKRIHPLEFPFAVEEQISALQRHSASFTERRNLRLRNSYFFENIGLRDFSRSTIEGQYGQAINFLFSQDILGIPAVIDFDAYCREKNILTPPGGSSRPDFVGCKKSTYWLIESKANLESSSIKNELCKGLNQCLAGATYLTANGLAAPERSYCSLVSFRLEGSSNDTVIHYADPEHESHSQEFNSLEFLHLYYEKVLKALGYADDPKEIWESDHAALFRSKSTYLGREFYSIHWDDSGGPLFGERRRRSQRAPEFYYAGVSVELIDALIRTDIGEYFQLASEIQEQILAMNEDLYIDTEDWLENELFVDGTIINTIW